jgi:hypothetical protein
VSPAPGTAAYAALLVERLAAAIGGGIAPAIESAAASSRNTVIYRVRAGGGRLVVKAARHAAAAADLAGAEATLRALEQGFAGPRVRALTPVCVLPEIGALVTREEAGEPLRAVIDRAIAGGASSPERGRAAALMDLAAEALHCFHCRFGLAAGAAGPPGGLETARLYLDFSPRNLLVGPGPAEETAVVLLDPPAAEERGEPHRDLGAFAFDLARAAFPPRALARRPEAWLDELKLRFLRAYFQRLGRAPGRGDLRAVERAEAARARQALRWYARFHRYRGWPRELARCLYCAPLVGLYLAAGLRRSYRRLEPRLAAAAPPLPSRLGD